MILSFKVVQKGMFFLLNICISSLSFAGIQFIDMNKSTNQTKATVQNSVHDSTNKPQIKYSPLDNIINHYAAQHNVPPDLIKAIIKQESGFNVHAVSPKGARGLMQLMPTTAASYGRYNLFNPQHNIAVGTKHLSYLLNKYNNQLHLALAAYNAGEGNVAKYGGIPPFSETQNYVLNVLKSYNSYLDQALLAKGVSKEKIIKMNQQAESNTNNSNKSRVLYLSLNE
ncbi:lytic transglycosylase domain-containing protein [Psychrobacter lutiphocae]|uniref:lytic transglycosylase domain-containing protein n=1 Tax=Psychrobacter lutiphocae TaxID=540500 RepID=UPI00035E03FF|nr:lytic transglycosylase domain-containing protein [Psychrobacter lutiphocae]